MARRVQASGRTGWYFRVLEEGSITQGVRGSLTSRPRPTGRSPAWRACCTAICTIGRSPSWPR
ncbi:MAG: hypothetical protein R3F59_35555 [Myxococcota bacterium]